MIINLFKIYFRHNQQILIVYNRRIDDKDIWDGLLSKIKKVSSFYLFILLLWN